MRHRPVDVRQILLGQREQHGDRLHLGDDDDAGVGRAHEIADIDHAHAGAPADRRYDAGVAEDGAGVLDRRVVRLDLRLELRDERALRVDRLGGDDVGGKAGVAFEIALGIGELHLVQHLFGDGLVELGLVGDRVDLGQQVALLDLLTLLEVD